MHIAVLANPGSWYSRDLQRAIECRGHQFSRLDFGRLNARLESAGPAIFAGEIDLAAVDAVIVRTMPPASLEQVVLRMDILARLEAAGTIVVNPPKAIECAVDKYLTTAKLQAADLPVPDTVVCENADTAVQALERLGGDVLVKPIFGAEGRGIVRVSDPDLAHRTFRTLERIQAALYLQRYVPHRGSDIRAIVLDGRIVDGIQRTATDGFRTNISQNGRAESHALTAAEEEYALRAAEAVGTRFAGVDLLHSTEGRLYVIEVNAVPGWRAFSKATSCDVAGLLVESLETGVRPTSKAPARYDERR